MVLARWHVLLLLASVALCAAEVADTAQQQQQQLHHQSPPAAAATPPPPAAAARKAAQLLAAHDTAASSSNATAVAAAKQVNKWHSLGARHKRRPCADDDAKCIALRDHEVRMQLVHCWVPAAQGRCCVSGQPSGARTGAAVGQDTCRCCWGYDPHRQAHGAPGAKRKPSWLCLMPPPVPVHSCPACSATRTMRP